MIKLGPAGVGGEIMSGLKAIRDMGLQAVEIEFTHGVRMSNEKAKKAAALGKSLGLELSVHAPYYINLASEDPDKAKASRQRILDSCERGHHLGAGYIVFHPGFYMGRDNSLVYSIIKKEIMALMALIKKKRYHVVLAPETTGKSSQFGDLDELLRLRKETGCGLCVDFAHLFARHQGKADFGKILDRLKGIRHIHSHFSGIEFTQKGEKRHIPMSKRFFRPLAKEILRRGTDITIISESPLTWKDSLKMREVIDELSSVKSK